MRAWCWPVPSQGMLQPLPPLPERPRRRSSRAKKHHHLSPVEVHRRRYRQQVTWAAVAALLIGGPMLYCQRDPTAEETMMMETTP